MNTRQRVRELSLAGLLSAVIIVMATVPFLGYIPLGFMNATIMHVPVITGAILLGPKYGAFLGLVFGMSSLIQATVNPNLTSFVFSPFITVGNYSGNIFSALIAIFPRVMIGIISAYIYPILMKLFKNHQMLNLWLTGIIGSLTNTILVMHGIYFFFGQSYIEATQSLSANIYSIFIGIIFGFGIPEAILAGIIVSAVCKVLLKIKLR